MGFDLDVEEGCVRVARFQPQHSSLEHWRFRALSDSPKAKHPHLQLLAQPELSIRQRPELLRNDKTAESVLAPCGIAH
jgi:hypothetical protein